MSSSNSYYSLPQDDDLFSLTFTQQNIPTLSHSQSSMEESPLSSYQDELSFNKNYNIDNTAFGGYEQPITPVQFNNNKTNDDDDDLIFELDNEFVSTFRQKSMPQTENNQITKQPQQDIFANVAQQNYRLWLSSV